MIGVVLMYWDYYPGGMIMPGRSGNESSYRYGYNSMEKDDEIKGSGNSLDFGARIYDPRVVRWLSLDPLAMDYPSLSDYVAMGNNPILFKDPDGQKIYIYYETEDSDGNTVTKAYEYGSGLKKPNDKYVRKTVRTLNRLQRKGRDSYGMINKIANDDANNIAITNKENWNASSFIVEVGDIKLMNEDGESLNEDSNFEIELPPDIISWNQNSGLISPDGKERQSAAGGLLHEVAHKYYTAYDPEGIFAEKASLESDEERNAWYDDMREKSGDYHNPADKWIIENVEVGMKGEWKRNNHADGYFLKTIGGTFSKIGITYGRWGVEGKVSDLKKGEAIEKPSDDTE